MLYYVVSFRIDTVIVSALCKKTDLRIHWIFFFCTCCRLWFLLCNKLYPDSNFQSIDFDFNSIEEKKMVRHNEDTSLQLNFAYCFRPIYYFARICGQMPFTISYPKIGAIIEAKYYKLDFIWCAISLGIQFSFIRLAFDLLTSSPRDSTVISSTIYFCNLTVWFVIILFGISMMPLDARNRLKIVEIFEKFNHFDQEVHHSNPHILHEFFEFSYVQLLFEFLSPTRWPA